MNDQISLSELWEYLEACGGEDVFEFYTQTGEPDLRAAHHFTHAMLERLPRAAVKASYHRVKLTLVPVATPATVSG